MGLPYVAKGVSRWLIDASHCKVHPILYLDAIFVKVKEEGHIRNKAVYLALAVTMEGQNNSLAYGLPRRKALNFG